MAQDCLFAYTPPDLVFPPYVNLSRDEAGDYVVTVRAAPEAVVGVTASIKLPRAELKKLFNALMRELIPTDKA